MPTGHLNTQDEQLDPVQGFLAGLCVLSRSFDALKKKGAVVASSCDGA